MRIKNFSIIFVTYLSVYLWLKVINEVSFKSIEYLSNLNDILLLLLLTAISYYILVTLGKDKDPLEGSLFDLRLTKWACFLLAVMGACIITSIISIKIGFWDYGNFLISFAVFIFSLTTIYHSLVEKGISD